jgi:hypothetical protein
MPSVGAYIAALLPHTNAARGHSAIGTSSADRAANLTVTPQNGALTGDNKRWELSLK